MVSKNRFPVKINFDPEQEITSFGGILPYLKIIIDKKFLYQLPGDKTRFQGWLDGQMILAIMFMNILGFDRVSDIDRLEKDKVLGKIVRKLEPYLFGRRSATLLARLRRGRRRTFPSARSIRDWLARFHDEAADQDRVKGEAYIPPPSRELQALHHINKVVLHQQIAMKGLTHLTIDIDATIIASGKKECKSTYRAANRTVPFEKGYQPLMGFSPELGLILHAEMRDGNVPANMDNLRFLAEILQMLPTSITSVAVRMDSAGYQHRIINFCNAPSLRPPALQRFGKIGFVLAGELTEAAMADIRATKGADWQPCCAGTAGLSGADLVHVPNKVATRPSGERVRYLAFRQRVNGLAIDPDEIGAGHWEGVGTTKLRLLVTNYPAPGAKCASDGALPAMDMWSVRAEANLRCGDSEQAHGMVKADFSAGILPSGKFGANSCWLFLACLSQNLVIYGRPLMTSGTAWLRVRMKAFRAAFIYRSARLVVHANQLILKFAATDSGNLEKGWNKLFRLQV
jgi:hypothetical protein